MSHTEIGWRKGGGKGGSKNAEFFLLLDKISKSFIIGKRKHPLLCIPKGLLLNTISSSSSLMLFY